ncbi:MAG: hypothetical protein JWN34_2026 [Bryobacterales bacterium]|nr:hypothetical protein [Bryobacterales bacterium]
MKALFLALAFCAVALAQSATPRTCPPGQFQNCYVMEAQSVPTTPTVITTSTLTLTGGWISCTSARTITLTDGNAIDVMPAVAVAANQVVSLTSVIGGAYISGGFSISASGSGCKWSAWWRQ